MKLVLPNASLNAIGVEFIAIKKNVLKMFLVNLAISVSNRTEVKLLCFVLIVGLVFAFKCYYKTKVSQT